MPTSDPNGSPPTGKPVPGHAYEAKDKWYRTLNGWKGPVEIVAMAAGIFYAIVTYYQWRDLRRNFETDARAWVMASEFKTAHHLETGQIVGVDVFYKNTGKTPSLNTRVSAAWIELDRRLPFSDVPTRWVPALPLAPNGIGSTRAYIRPEVIKRLIAGETGGYVFGTIWYDDIFGRQHWNQYCVVIGTGVAPWGACSLHVQSSEAQEQ
jgi:hypothetical protein